MVSNCSGGRGSPSSSSASSRKPPRPVRKAGTPGDASLRTVQPRRSRASARALSAGSLPGTATSRRRSGAWVTWDRLAASAA